MFSRNGGGSGDAPVPPGQDGPAGAPIAVPEVPAIRQFMLTRVRPGAPYMVYPTSSPDGIPNPDYVETFNIAAHEVEINAAGNILRFREFIIHPSEGPTNKVVRCFNGWLDYEEVLPVVPEPSRLITPFDGRIQ